MSSVLFVGGNDRSLWANRGDLIAALLEWGCRVDAALPQDEGVSQPPLCDVAIERIPMIRAGLNPANDLRSILALRSLFRRLRPDAVLAYNPKPVIHSSLALTGVSGTRLVALITGRGALERRPGFQGRVALRALGALYRAALRRPDVLLFQNQDDRAFFESKWTFGHSCTVAVVPGSGVNLKRFPQAAPPDGPLRFLVVSRLLIDKGVREFVAAARALARDGSGCQFRVVGGHDPSLPHAVPEREVRTWDAEGIVEFVGRVDDVRPHLEWCSVLCHPSYCEGTPRAVLEALSTGRPVITTDAPGCRQTIEPGVSGFLVPPRDAEALATRMRWFVEHPSAAAAMGLAARTRACDVYDVRKVNVIMIEHLLGVPRAG